MQLVGNIDTLLPPQQQQQDASSETAAVEAVGSSSSAELQFSPAGLLLSAVSSSSAALRMEALEMACVNARCGVWWFQRLIELGPGTANSNARANALLQ
jgi:hypothetical protein